MPNTLWLSVASIVAFAPAGCGARQMVKSAARKGEKEKYENE
jgi:hypothetical protein